MGEYTYSTIRVSDWQEFKEEIQRFSENWAFRGQANANWMLNNAIERTHFIHYKKGLEAEFVAEFQRGARNYLSNDEMPQHLIEWLALMQHHGAPTRLLDLTRSPFIAAYFAFEQCLVKRDHWIAIWGFNIESLKSRAIEELARDLKNELGESPTVVNEAVFKKIFYDNNRKIVFPVEPFAMNRRYSLQQSIFISTGTSDIPLMDQLAFLGEDLPRTVVKLEVPAIHKFEVLRDLLKMNLNRASLFPDLDGYATSLRLRYESMKTPGEMLRENVEKIEDGNFPYNP